MHREIHRNSMHEILALLKHIKRQESVSRLKRNNGKSNIKYHWTNATIPFIIDSTVISKFWYFFMAFKFFKNVCLSFRSRSKSTGSDDNDREFNVREV
jgi:hypothetical protein